MNVALEPITKLGHGDAGKISECLGKTDCTGLHGRWGSVPCLRHHVPPSPRGPFSRAQKGARASIAAANRSHDPLRTAGPGSKIRVPSARVATANAVVPVHFAAPRVGRVPGPFGEMVGGAKENAERMHRLSLIFVAIG